MIVIENHRLIAKVNDKRIGLLEARPHTPGYNKVNNLWNQCKKRIWIAYPLSGEEQPSI